MQLSGIGKPQASGSLLIKPYWGYGPSGKNFGVSATEVCSDGCFFLAGLVEP